MDRKKRRGALGSSGESKDITAVPRTPNQQDHISLLPVPSQNPRTPEQAELDLHIQRQIEVDGVEMGVLTDGTAFLSGRGLARLCGIDSSRVSEMAADWDSASPKPITAKVKKILQDHGLQVPEYPYIEIKETGAAFHAYSDVVCLAVLEYYAFEAGPGLRREQALQNYRLLAGKSLHDFIYTQVGYDPNYNIPSAWAQFHARVSLTHNRVPAGYFSVFKELADMIVTLGEAGLHIDSGFVPDISVGGQWGHHWDENDFDTKYGERRKWEHNYPEIFPQSKSNPQHAWCYPDAALGEFRRWCREIYIGSGKFSNYINTQIKKRALPPAFAQLVTKAYNLDGGGYRALESDSN